MTTNASKTELPRFMQKQYEFASHIRNPQQHPRPADVETRRMAVYNELFYNNVQDFMASSFPVLRSLLDDNAWHELIRDYFARHRASTPLFPEMPREFLRYLENEREPREGDLPFLLELAHYEWVELALSLLDQEVDDSQLDTEGDLFNGIPVLSPLAWPLQYHYPVQQIGPEFIPQQPGETPTFLLVYRDPEDQIHFLDLNPVTARLLQLIQEDQEQTGEQLLKKIAEELNHPNPQVVIEGGLQILNDMQQRGVILGSRGR
jgi:hypothetical protein